MIATTPMQDRTRRFNERGTESVRDIIVQPAGRLSWRDLTVDCALGKTGVAENKREGDGATPIGCFPLRRLLYRPDRVALPRTALPVAPLTPRDGWCDDPADPLYNQQIRQPYPGGYEVLWRADHIYDVIVVLGHNDGPVVPGAGSAIFLHVARPGFAPTEGCIALALPDLLTVLEGCDPRGRVCVRAGSDSP